MAKKEINQKENSKNKRSFFKDFKAELKKVVWLTPKQLVNNTVAVITIVLITAIIVFVLDFAFREMNEQGLDRLKASIQSSVQKNETNENTAVDESNTTSEESTEGETSSSEENVESTENTEGTESTETTENTDGAEETPTENTAE